MATLVPFAIKKDDGTVITTLAPSNNANGIAEFKNADSARSQAYLATGRVSGAAQTRRFTFKLSVPKVSSQIVNGVELPVTAWRAYVDVSVQVPIFASGDDCILVAQAIQSAFAKGTPFDTVIRTGVGFY